jgi:hypothetical protein
VVDFGQQVDARSAAFDKAISAILAVYFLQIHTNRQFAI